MIDEIIEAAHDRGVAVLVDAAQLAPRRPLPRDADYLAWSGHKMYAPFGVGVLVGPRATFATGEPFLAGRGCRRPRRPRRGGVDRPARREEAGSPNVLGAVALHAAMDDLNTLSWDAIRTHDDDMARRFHEGLAGIDGVRLLGPARCAARGVVCGRRHLACAGRRSAQRRARHRCPEPNARHPAGQAPKRLPNSCGTATRPGRS